MFIVHKAKIIHTNDLEKDFRKYGYNPEKLWDLNKNIRTIIITKYTACYAQTVSNRRFNKKVYKMTCNEKIQIFFTWLDKSKYKDLLK